MIAPKLPMLQNLSALMQTTNFQNFIEHLRQSHLSITSQLIQADDSDRMRVLQGRLRELEEIIEACTKAPQSLKAIEAHAISSEHLP